MTVPKAGIIDPDRWQEIAERNQLWASLRAIRAEIEHLASGPFDGSPRRQERAVLLARSKAPEIQFRENDAAAE